MRMFWLRAAGPALHEAIIGALIAIVASVIVYGTSISQYGSDLAQQLFLRGFYGLPGDQLSRWPLPYLWEEVGAALGLPPAQPAGCPGPVACAWVFIDLGPRFCGVQDSRKENRKCFPDKPRADRKDLVSLLRNVRTTLKPRVIVLDIWTDTDKDTEADDKELMRILREEEGAPVLLAWYSRADPYWVNGMTGLDARNAGLLFQPDNRIEPPAHARYLPAMRSRSGLVARYLEAEYEVLTDSGRTRQPGIAYGAALVAQLSADDKRPLSRIDEEFDHDLNSHACPIGPTHRCQDFLRTERVFGFPNTSLERSPEMYHPPFYRVAPRSGADLSGVPIGAVVVIGDSRAEAYDLAATAIGNVSGAELILNDIWQYSATLSYPTPGIWSRIADKSVLYLGGMLAVFFGHMLIHRLWREARPKGRNTWWRRARNHLINFARSMTMVSVAWVLTVVFVLVLLITGVYKIHNPGDFLTPFITLALELVYELIYRLRA